MGVKVFKFGGASVKDAASLQNVVEIVQRYPNDKLVLVASAMGKTTNALEEIMTACWNKDETSFFHLLNKLSEQHLIVLKNLFPDPNHLIHVEIQSVFTTLESRIHLPQGTSYDFEYDQIVSLGEVISTLILNAILVHANLASVWVDAREIIRTNSNYREGEIDWNTTENKMKPLFDSLFVANDMIVIQGFLGHTAEGNTTTLGREGSDFTAGICAYCLNAEQVTIWKDVPGMLNADPRKFENTVKLDQISFYEAIELSYYGASVIHPKTVKPLQNKNIPLFVKSFIDPEANGTVIQSSKEFDHLIPSFISKNKQVLISITPKDFSFIEEENLGKIFAVLSAQNIKINMMQNSALSFSIALDQEKVKLPELIAALADYSITYNDNLELVTIRHYNEKTVQDLKGKKEVVLEQKTRETVRFLLKG